MRTCPNCGFDHERPRQSAQPPEKLVPLSPKKVIFPMRKEKKNDKDKQNEPTPAH